MDSWKICDVIRIFRMDWNVFLEIKKKEKKKNRIGRIRVYFRSRFKDGIDL